MRSVACVHAAGIRLRCAWSAPALTQRATCACACHRSYISAPWFSIQQAPNSYQPRNNLYCVRAEYRKSERDPARLLVFNQARQGSVTGTQQAGGGFLLNAVVKDESRGKLAVGPPFLPTSAYGAQHCEC